MAIEDTIRELGRAHDDLADQVDAHREEDQTRFDAIEAAIGEQNERLRDLARVVADSNAALIKAIRADKPASGDDPAFADPGYQPDKKPRYPIGTEEEIRAAWSYIHTRRDENEYTAKQLEEIERRIVAAWKKKIDRAGPPEAQDEEREHRTARSTRSARAGRESEERGEGQGGRGKRTPPPRSGRISHRWM